MKARVKWKPGVFTDDCGSQTKVLVVESCVGGHPIWLYVTCPDSAFEDEAEMQRIAILAAQAYGNRWQIERPFETVKQEFSLEKLRVRTFRRLGNVFSLCVVAYLFVTRHLRASSVFVFRPKARTAWAESLDRFWDCPERFFAQCFQGSREDSG